MNLPLVIVFATFIAFINGTLLFWSTKDIQIPALKYFNENDLESLLMDLNNPQIIAFQNDFSTTENIPKKLEHLYSAYVPNGNMYIENVTALTDDTSNNLNMIKETLDSFNDQKNKLVIISSPNIRAKRDTNNTESNDINQEELRGPVLYSDKGEAMIYSSRPLILRTITKNYTLGSTSKVTVSRYATFDILAATIPVGKGTITLKFRFQQSRGYWTLQTVQVGDGVKGLSSLNTSSSIGAENNYSYHCFGETVFKGSNMELILYEIQVQPYTKNGRFSSAYDCVTFTTVPIWSGLMVSFILIIGLFFGFGALASIKTMDKFDNSKTKQLTFTISE